MAEPAEISDTGIHLPSHSAACDPASAAHAQSHQLNPASLLLSSLQSLPPRAAKRRRGARRQEEQAAADEESVQQEQRRKRMEEQARMLQAQPMRERQFEYLDHTADIQLHSWGSSLSDALEQCVIAMFSYMTDLSKVDIDPKATDVFEVKGHDLDSLLFTLLDEFLYRFLTNEWIPRDVRVQSLDLRHFRCVVAGFGERFTLEKHTQGTEIKAITYSNMQIFVAGKRAKSDNEENRKRSEDRDAAAASSSSAAADADAQAEEETSEQHGRRTQHGAEIYVIVDI